MIIKKRKIPRSILKLQALLRRLASRHSQLPLIIEDLKKKAAGYKGERSLDFPLGFIEQKNFNILHDLRLEDQSRYFQIDTLLLTRKMCLIIEVKNIAGIIYFDPIFKQLIRTKDGKETAFPYPITQLERQELQLKEWFRKNRLQEIPIFSLVVISNPQTIIRTSPENLNLTHKVIHRDYLPTKINQIENSIDVQVLQEKELKKLSKLLLKHHTEADFPILEQYKIMKDEILKGVICLNCNHIPMVRVKGNWYCPHCKSKSKDAHIQALKDYQLLFGSTITNSELRDFLQIHSSDVATRLLRSMNLISTGNNKNRVYTLSFDEEDS